MRTLKKAVMLFLAVLLIAAVSPAAFAAADVSVEAGKSTTLTFAFEDVYNVDGAFTVSDPDAIVSKYTISVKDAGATSAVVSGDRLWAAPGAEPVKTDVKVDVALTLSGKASVGAACTVSFSGVYGDANEKPGNEHDVYQAATVTVKETPVAPPPQTEDPKPEPKVDYTELKKQISIADELKSTGYTTDSWSDLSAALKDGKAALKSTSQSAVDTAAAALENAIAALVKMDYTQLNAALNDVDAFMESEELADLWEQLADAVADGKGLLNSGDQSAVDAAAAKIADLLAQIKAALEELRTPETIIQEVPVETLPEDDFCNIPMHRVWPVLFFVSLALNVILLGAVVLFAAKKRKNRKDDTPLVDYDIGDDA